MRYFIGGFTWNRKSQFERFVKNNIWENGYEEDKYSDLVSQISVGDLFALKSTYVIGRKPNAKSYLKIKKIGIVTQILSNSSIQIEWKDTHEFDLTNIRWYANTLEEISDKVDVEKIFGNIKKELQMSNYLNLLGYKKQIILQGPPGTGKTREAEEIAKELLKLTPDIIRGVVSVGEKISNASGATDYYTITSIANDSISLTSDRTTQDWSAPYTEIIDKYEQLKNGQIPANQNGTHPYSLAIAKHLNQLTLEKLFDSQFKLIQFHPSYTYEDFVRGIVAESKGDKIEYKNVNKTLGMFAKEALENYKLSRDNNHEAVINKWVDEKFEEFKADVEQRVEEKMLLLSGAIGIFQVEQDCFRYGVEWQVPSRINFRDFKQIVRAVIDGHLALGNPIPKHISVHAHYRNTYYASLLNDFFEKFEFKSINSKEREKNYVLIVDEINRANLSSVLGELIYALEYRGKEVNSMYKIEDSEQLILPPNLYIIGTMNTADRSVGHIDYAIRRRFAFVDVLPKDLSNDDTIIFHKGLFEKVSRLFIKNYDEYLVNEKTPLKATATLSSEFRPEDVWLGHSYFIQKKEKDESGNEIFIPNEFSIRLEYEIKPILLEYVKDGILVGENIKDEIFKLEV